MRGKYFKFFFNVLLICFLATVQFSFISGLPYFLDNFNLALVALIVILGFFGLNESLWWALGVGFLLDLFSFAPFGVFLISLVLAVLLADFLLNNFFTNRSLYSFLALTFFSTVFYFLIFIVINYMARLVILKDVKLIFNFNFLLDFGAQIVLNLIFVLVSFYLAGFLSARLRPAFLAKKSLK